MQPAGKSNRGCLGCRHTGSARHPCKPLRPLQPWQPRQLAACIPARTCLRRRGAVPPPAAVQLSPQLRMPYTLSSCPVLSPQHAHALCRWLRRRRAAAAVPLSPQLRMPYTLSSCPIFSPQALYSLLMPYTLSSAAHALCRWLRRRRSANCCSPPISPAARRARSCACTQAATRSRAQPC